MTYFPQNSRSRRTVLSLSAALLTTLPPTAAALAQTVPVETITVQGQRNTGTATDIAPTSTPLDAIQPTSVISQDFIEKNLPLSTNYDEAIKFSPSVFNTAPNGPGLAESQNISIRGFQDGQFNVTFDGIPWGDANDFTHHSTSYFMAHDLGQISVDRGPGTAATIGNATFGGTVSILSKAPDDQMSIKPYVSYGSWNTATYGAEIDSGKIDQYNGARLILDGEGLNSDGYLSDMGQQRQNGFLKYIQPINDSTTLTFVAMFNHIEQGISLGATKAEIAQNGPNFALSNDPANQNYSGFNHDSIRTDFEYVDLESDLGDGWDLDSKIYSYGYYHTGLNGEDPNGSFPNGTLYGANDVPGQLLENNYRSIGTITRVSKDFGLVEVKAGLWYDHQWNDRSLSDVDLSQGRAINLDPDAVAQDGTVDGYVRLLHQDLTTIQPYLQADIKPIDGLVLSPGVRYSYFDRNVNSVVNVTGVTDQGYDNSYSKTLPSLSANYRIQPDWAVYAQVAQGFLAPNEKYVNAVNPGSTSISPEESWNYQLGTSFQSGGWSASFDGYYIDFSNLIGSTTVGGQQIFYNQGGVIYKGLEAELTRVLGYGFSLYGNGSLNSAKAKDGGLWIANAPEATAAFGAIYDQNGINGSILGKWIGSRYGNSGQTEGLDPFYTVDMALGYRIEHLTQALKDASIKFEVNNLTNVTKIINFAGSTNDAAGTSLYWTQPGRSYFVTLTGTF